MRSHQRSRDQTPQPCLSPLQQERGFTLLEVVIAMAITAVITSLLYGTFRTTLQTATIIDEKADVYRRARIIFYQLNKDISMIFHKKPSFASSPSPEGYFSILPMKGEDDIRFAEGGIYPADTLHFASLSYQPVRQGIPLSGQANITYLLVDDKLVRRATFREKSIEHEIGEAVLGMSFRYFDDKKKDWVEGWDPQADSFPKAIEMELILKRASEPASPSNSDQVAVPEYHFKTTFALETVIL